MPQSVQNSQWIQIYKNFLRNGINTAQYAPPGAPPTGNQIAPGQATSPPPQQVAPPMPNEDVGVGTPIGIPDVAGGGGQPPPAGGGGGAGRGAKGKAPMKQKSEEGNAYQDFLKGAYGV